MAKNLLVILSVLLMDNFTELWEVDVSIPDDVVGQVYDLLLHGVQAQHLHGRQQVLNIFIVKLKVNSVRFNGLFRLLFVAAYD